MRYFILSAAFAAALLVVYGCSDYVTGPDKADSTATPYSVAGAQSPSSALHSTATVLFGRSTGSPFFPPGEHDASSHAQDKLQPRTTVIATGGTVTFEVAPFHYPAIYEPGIEPEDIDTQEIEQEEGCPIPSIDDEEGRIAEGEPNCTLPPQTVPWSYTFEKPGRYLVICQMLPHFVDSNMYGWVVVK
ncbi:MAG TPA: hypothetical protein VFG50_13010 [Rhodothermales bacterium]|nr:hypothetical protein [Rhodothermales bacterium]